MSGDVLISVPKGWTRVDSPGEIVVEGPLPDTDEQRNAYMRIVLKTEDVAKSHGWSHQSFRGTGLAWRGGSMQLRREVKETRWDAKTQKHVETGKWRRGGIAGPRLVTTLLWTLAHCGGRW